MYSFILRNRPSIKRDDSFFYNNLYLYFIITIFFVIEMQDI